MSIYSKDVSINNGDLTQTEIHLYACPASCGRSSRLGVYNLKNNVQRDDPNPGRIITFTRGNKFFELSNHLGNILATVSDKKQQHSSDNATVDYFTADVVSANDYYPFGMLMPGRKYSVANTNYRYGFNGKELDKEVAGTTTYDYGFRIYNPGLGRFLSVDPLTKKYAELTPYQFASNSPIAHVDLDGLESEYYTKTITYTRVHKANQSILIPPITSISVTSNYKSTGWFTPNGNLGSGTKITVQEQVVDVYLDVMGIKTGTQTPPPKTLFEVYKPSSADNSSNGWLEGIAFYTFGGQNGETRKGKFTKDMVNIDGLLAISKAPTEFNNWENVVKIIYDINNSINTAKNDLESSSANKNQIKKPDPVHDTVDAPARLESAEYFRDGSVRGYLKSTGNQIVLSNNNETPDTIRHTEYAKPTNKPLKK